MRSVTSLWVACALLTACAGGSRHSRHGELGFVDTETAGKARHAAYVAEQASARAATRAMVSPLLRAIPPAVLALMQENHDADELEKQLAACAVQAEQVGNARYFQDRPRRGRSAPRWWRRTAAASPSPGPCNSVSGSTCSPWHARSRC
ncbi:hypothetical protein KH5H1_22140 [Corallococcus caeni]|nr:hypothetical protein KH5H1_22140 [Corallococcus sp. KH5-1]